MSLESKEITSPTSGVYEKKSGHTESHGRGVEEWLAGGRASLWSMGGRQHLSMSDRTLPRRGTSYPMAGAREGNIGSMYSLSPPI